MGLYDMIDNDVKSHFVSETDRKNEAIEELIVKINKDREELEEHMSGNKKSDEDVFTKQEIDEATKYIINNEYSIYINPQIDEYNNTHSDKVKTLTQEQFDSITQFYWNCGTRGGGYYDGFYDDVVEAQALIEKGTEESLKLAEDKMTDAFDNYRKGTPGFDSDADTRSEEAADLFVNGNY